MARYCVAFESMKRFLGLKGNKTLADLVSTYIQTHTHTRSWLPIQSNDKCYLRSHLCCCLRWGSYHCVRSLPMWGWEWTKRELLTVSTKTKTSPPSGKAAIVAFFQSWCDDDVGFLWMARLSQPTWKWTGIYYYCASFIHRHYCFIPSAWSKLLWVVCLYRSLVSIRTLRYWWLLCFPSTTGTTLIVSLISFCFYCSLPPSCPQKIFRAAYRLSKCKSVRLIPRPKALPNFQSCNMESWEWALETRLADGYF